MGALFGRYELLDLLGRGGMGNVYRAHDTRLGRDVALKRLPAHLARDAEFEARFQRECRIVARLEHPHIVPIHDYGEIDGMFFIDMRLLHGRDLARVLESGPLEPAMAVEVVAQVANALDAAHTAGVLHRDVKPSNIMLTGKPSAPFAYLVDFGIATADGQPAITATAEVLGSLPYLAPERISSGAIDRRSDVYALACVLYEALTAEQPYPRLEPAGILYAHLHTDPPRPTARRPALPDALDEVIARGMAKGPESRYARAGELADAARAALADPRTKPLAPTQRMTAPLATQKRHGFRLAVLAAVLLVLLGGGSLAVALLSGSNGSRRAGSSTSAPLTGSLSKTTITTRSSTATSTTRISAAPGFAVGDCVNGTQAVACSGPHGGEIFAISSGTACNLRAALAYLGGQPNVDTLLPSVSSGPGQQGETSFCEVHPPAGAPAGSAKAILTSHGGDAWRYCVDEPTHKTVGCNQRHTLEYAYTTTATKPIDCDASAASYLGGIPLTNVKPDLQVESFTSGGLQVCALRVTGANVLLKSVRNLGTSSLPEEPR